jgi:hypothetical protein
MAAYLTLGGDDVGSLSSRPEEHTGRDEVHLATSDEPDALSACGEQAPERYHSEIRVARLHTGCAPRPFPLQWCRLHRK